MTEVAIVVSLGKKTGCVVGRRARRTLDGTMLFTVVMADICAGNLDGNFDFFFFFVSCRVIVIFEHLNFDLAIVFVCLRYISYMRYGKLSHL